MSNWFTTGPVEIGDAPNFKPRKRSISVHSGLELKQEAGEIQYGSMQEGAESYQVATYAKGFLIQP
ncbi:MAG: hypothetical protein IPN92_20760 [Chromatiaceae bacterium]|nr:hypothetical protein [Chromatiaceae bacterium]